MKERVSEQDFEKRWDFERFSRLYRAASDALSWSEDRLMLNGQKEPVEERVCLAVISEDLRSIVSEFEEKLFEHSLPSSELAARAQCVLEEVHNLQRRCVKGILIPFPKPHRE